MRPSTPGRLVLLGIVLCAGCAAGVRADDEPPAWASLAPDGSMGAGNNDAPRFTRNDVQLESQRSLPGYRNEVNELSYRWWASKGRSDLGVGIGTISYVARPTGMVQGLAGDGALLASGTVLMLGMRYRTSERSALYADAAGVHGLGLDGREAVVGKVGIEFKAAQSRWNVAYGGLGFHLAGDTRMTLRVRKGGLGIYMRRSF